MNKKQYDFLKRLMNTMSPTGFEREAARIWRSEAEKFADQVYSDTHGNSFAVINPNGRPRVMLAGHIDEIGLMVTYIDAQGFIYFSGIGGWDPQVLPGQHVQIHTKRGFVPGVIGRRPIHLLTAEERRRVVRFEGLWIDIGARNKKDAASVVDIGDPAVVRCEMQELKNDLIAGRGFDDKIGAFIILEALRILSKNISDAAVYAVATAQEEIGLRGAQTSAFGIDPDAGIVVDVGFATDTPGSKKDKQDVGDVTMGKGPIITRGPNINPILFDMFIKSAKKNKIPVQVVANPRATGTDARIIQVTRQGVPTVLLGAPNRYMHSPCEIVHKKDIVNISKLIAHAVASMSAKTDFVVR